MTQRPTDIPPTAAASETASEPSSVSHIAREDLAVFAHELRGALTVIGGYSDMLRRPLHETERIAALDGIRRAIQRADALCADVLAGKPPATAGGGSEVGPLELCMLAGQVAAEQRVATGRTIVIEAPCDVVVIGEEPTLERVLTNLVTNAAKYSPAAEPVLIEVCRATTAELGETAVVEVSDRGMGIPHEERLRLFEPFQRLVRDSDIPGTGLGLAIVHDVIAAHGGRVEIRDRDSGGTTIRIELPLFTDRS